MIETIPNEHNITYGTVRVPFQCICKINRRPFHGWVAISYLEPRAIIEYDSFLDHAEQLTGTSTTVEELAADIYRSALKAIGRVRVDVWTAGLHIPAHVVVGSLEVPAPETPR